MYRSGTGTISFHPGTPRHATPGPSRVRANPVASTRIPPLTERKIFAGGEKKSRCKSRSETGHDESMVPMLPRVPRSLLKLSGIINRVAKFRCRLLRARIRVIIQEKPGAAQVGERQGARQRDREESVG